MQVTLLTRTITIAGVIPIVGLGLLSFVDDLTWVKSTLSLYLFGIVMFMLGTLWGQAQEDDSNSIAIISNVLFFIALCAYTLLDNNLWLIASAGILGATFFIEKVISDISDDYKQLRTEATILACTVIMVIVILRQF